MMKPTMRTPPSPSSSPSLPLLLRILSCLLVVSSSSSFQLSTTDCSLLVISGTAIRGSRKVGRNRSSRKVVSSCNAGTALFAVSSSNNDGNERPPPRRTLAKRKNKRTQRISNQFTATTRQGVTVAEEDTNFDGEEYYDNIEIRPIRRRDAIEAGLDYWIDETDLEKERLRRKTMRQKRRANETGVKGKNEQQISREKLKEEMAAPYKQNWIGLLSVGVVVLSAIATRFPELLNVPIIPIPDL